MSGYSKRRTAREQLGHNGGPPLEEERHVPEWGSGPIGNYFFWKAAHRAIWKNTSPEIRLFRFKRAERVGLTYEEYMLEILDRGRYLSLPDDADRIAQIKAARKHGAESDKGQDE